MKKGIAIIALMLGFVTVQAQEFNSFILNKNELSPALTTTNNQSEIFVNYHELGFDSSPTFMIGGNFKFKNQGVNAHFRRHNFDFGAITDFSASYYKTFTFKENLLLTTGLQFNVLQDSYGFDNWWIEQPEEYNNYSDTYSCFSFSSLIQYKSQWLGVSVNDLSKDKTYEFYTMVDSVYQSEEKTLKYPILYNIHAGKQLSFGKNTFQLLAFYKLTNHKLEHGYLRYSDVTGGVIWSRKKLTAGLGFRQQYANKTDYSTSEAFYLTFGYVFRDLKFNYVFTNQDFIVDTPKHSFSIVYRFDLKEKTE